MVFFYVYGSDYGFVSTQNLIIPYFVTFNGIVFRNFIAIKTVTLTFSIARMKVSVAVQLIS